MSSERVNAIKVLTGIAATTPVKPTIINTVNVKQHPLSYIHVKPGATEITSDDIEVVVGTSECPFVTGILETTSIDTLYAQWNERFYNRMDVNQSAFNEWFINLKNELDSNQASNLQNQINQVNQKITDANIDSLSVNIRKIQLGGI